MSEQISARVVSVQVGRPAPLMSSATISAFLKHPVMGPVATGPEGLEGDEQADRTVHGGPEKAVYAYPAAHYPAWAAEFPEHAAIFGPGAMGENLTIDGLVEDDLCVGDVHGIGTARLQVCQPRQPCFKLTRRFGEPRLGRAMVRSGRAGWYYRVLTPGVIAAGDAVTLLDRFPPEYPFPRLVVIMNRAKATPEERALLATIPGIPAQFRDGVSAGP